MWIEWTSPLDLTSCRGLAIVQASPRLIYAEPSLEKRRGLGISVESKEKLSKIEGEVLYNQRGAASKGKRKEASAKPKRTVAGGGEGEREEASAKPKRTVAGGGKRMGVLSFALFT